MNDIGTPFFQNGKHRAARRYRPPMLHPPEAEMRLLNWHVINTATSSKVLQWRPGIEVWYDREGSRYPAEKCAEWGWTYNGRANV